MQVTADDARQARLAQSGNPTLAVLRLEFFYNIQEERSQRPVSCFDTVAILVEPGVPLKKIEAGFSRALVALGANLPDVSRCQIMDLHSPSSQILSKTAVSWTFSINAGPALSLVSCAEDALSIVAVLGREMGVAAAEAVGAVGARRAADMPGATSVMDGVGKAFEELGALRAALLVKGELESLVPKSIANTARRSL